MYQLWLQGLQLTCFCRVKSIYSTVFNFHGPHVIFILTSAQHPNAGWNIQQSYSESLMLICSEESKSDERRDRFWIFSPRQGLNCNQPLPCQCTTKWAILAGKGYFSLKLEWYKNQTIKFMADRNLVLLLTPNAWKFLLSRKFWIWKIVWQKSENIEPTNFLEESE